MASPGQTPEGDDAEPLHAGSLYSGKEGDADRNYVEVLPHEVRGGVTGEPEVDFWERSAELELVEITVDGRLADVHLHTGTGSDADGKAHETWRTVSVPAVAPMVATLGSPTFHGGVLGPGIGSPNVFAEGKPVWRMLRDAHLCATATPQPHGTGVVLPMGPPSGVFVNGFPVARAGDAVVELLGGPDPIVSGAASVIAGRPAPPVLSIDPVPEIVVEEDPWYTRLRRWVVDVDVEAGLDVQVLPGQGTLRGSGAVDLDDRRLEGQARYEAKGELVRGTARADVRVQIFGGFVDWDPDAWVAEGGLGSWSGYADVLFDPVTKRPRFDGDISLGGED